MDVDQLLAEGIGAAKAREVDRARELLLQVVEIDEENESAWLWLSGLMPSKQDRRVCLENVLTINPDNEMARKGLERLGPPAAEEMAAPDEAMVAEETAPDVLPVSFATADPLDEPAPFDVPPFGEPVVESEEPLYAAPPTPAFTEPPLEPAAAETMTAVDEGLPDFLKPQPEPEPVARPVPAAPAARAPAGSTADRLLWNAAIIMLILVCLGLAFIAIFTIGGAVGSLELPSFGVNATEEAPFVIGVVHDNLSAYNAQNIDAYMATIHPSAPGRSETRQSLDQLVGTYELHASLERADLLSISSREAEVGFTLVTRKISGPDFRDNRIDGVMILRRSDGEWKLYDQRVDNVTYLDQ